MKLKLQRVLLTALAIFTFLLKSVGQTSSISGKVSTATNELIPGVSIQIKGINVGAITDVNGINQKKMQCIIAVKHSI
jgi:uncharacterized protein YbbC (DUF1343 family)